MLSKLLLFLSMAQKYAPIIVQLVSEIVDNLKQKEAAGVKNTLPPDQLKTRTSEIASQVADFIHAADCSCEESCP